MIWESWLDSIAPSLGMTTEQAGIILSLLITLAFTLSCMMAAPDHALLAGTFGFLVGLIIFTYVQWFPLWTGTATALIVSIIVGGKIAGRI